MMSTDYDIFNPFGLDYRPVPQKLVFRKLPVTEIHQSWISTFRQCKQKSYLSAKLSGGPSPFYMFLGSVFHAAFEHAVRSDLDQWYKIQMNEGYWKEIFSFIPNKPTDFNDDWYAMKMVQMFNGTTVGFIIKTFIAQLKGTGFEVLACERKLRYQPGNGIPFVGTLDILVRRNGRLAIIDTKTSGLWGMFKDKASSKETYTIDQIRQHLQLRHYHWLGYRAGDWKKDEVYGYGIFVPTNLTKYVKGPNTGQWKGPPIFWGDVKPTFIDRYEDDLVEWLRDAERGSWPRYYPGTFGKIECTRCPFNQRCLGDELSSALPPGIEEQEEDLY